MKYHSFLSQISQESFAKINIHPNLFFLKIEKNGEISKTPQMKKDMSNRKNEGMGWEGRIGRDRGMVMKYLMVGVGGGWK